MKINIIYWSGTGNTASMATLISEGAAEIGADVQLINVSLDDISDALNANIIALGCPSMGSEILEEDEFEPFICSIESSLKGKKIALFGSYGWGDGQWMRDWSDRMEKAGAIIVSPALIVNSAPGDDSEQLCRQLGVDLAKIK
jgi:flavodoxin short chain